LTYIIISADLELVFRRPGDSNHRSAPRVPGPRSGHGAGDRGACPHRWSESPVLGLVIADVVVLVRYLERRHRSRLESSV